MDAADAQGLGAVAEPQGDPTDTLSAVLEAVHLTGAVFFLVEGAAPWVAEAPASTQLAPVILQDAQHIVSYHVITQGSCWCESPGQTPLRLETGDVLVVPHGHAYQVGDCVRSPHRMVVGRDPPLVSGDGWRPFAFRGYRRRRRTGASAAGLRVSRLRCIAVQPGVGDTTGAGASASPW